MKCNIISCLVDIIVGCRLCYVVVKVPSTVYADVGIRGVIRVVVRFARDPAQLPSMLPVIAPGAVMDRIADAIADDGFAVIGGQQVESLCGKLYLPGEFMRNTSIVRP